MTDGGIGVWGTPEGHRSRLAAGARMAAARRQGQEMAAGRDVPGVPATPQGGTGDPDATRADS